MNILDQQIHNSSDGLWRNLVRFLVLKAALVRDIGNSCVPTWFQKLAFLLTRFVLLFIVSSLDFSDLQVVSIKLFRVSNLYGKEVCCEFMSSLHCRSPTWEMSGQGF